MKSYTRPPSDPKNFRQKKYEEATSRAQYSNTLDFNTTAYSNAAAGYELAYSIEIPTKYISGKGDSIRCRFAGVTAASANTKFVELRLAGGVIHNGRVDDGSGLLFLWSVELEIFSSSLNNQEQISVARSSSVGGAFGAATEDYGSVIITTFNANSPLSLDLYISGVLAGENTFRLAKVEFSPAP